MQKSIAKNVNIGYNSSNWSPEATKKFMHYAKITILYGRFSKKTTNKVASINKEPTI